MEVAASVVVEKTASKTLTKKQRQIKKIKETMARENRIYWENIEDSTAVLSERMKRFADDHPKIVEQDAEDAQNKFFEMVAQEQYKQIRKLKLLHPVKPKQAKVIKPKPIKVVKPKAIKPQKISKAEKAFNLLYQKFSSLIDQELAAEFVLNEYTSLEKPKPEYWCTICKVQFPKLSGVNRHFKKKHMPSTTETPSALPEPSIFPESSSPTNAACDFN